MLTAYAEANRKRWADPEYRARVSAAISRAHKKQSTQISKRVKGDWSRLTVKQRQTRTQHLWKGPGRISSVQLLLWKELGHGWVLELPVGTGSGARSKGLPCRYFIDIAHRARKVAVEVDGSFHKLTRQRDRQRDRLLQQLGWTVIRVTNRDVQNNPKRVAQSIRRQL